MKIKWETLFSDENSHTLRMKVYGGWVVRTLSWFDHDEFKATGLTESSVFVPDLKHAWKLKEKE